MTESKIELQFDTSQLRSIYTQLERVKEITKDNYRAATALKNKADTDYQRAIQEAKIAAQKLLDEKMSAAHEEYTRIISEIDTNSDDSIREWIKLHQQYLEEIHRLRQTDPRLSKTILEYAGYPTISPKIPTVNGIKKRIATEINKETPTSKTDHAH